ncbi:MAG: cyclic-di-AMP receptor [Anaerolineae bacterium]|jgi:uncharacterized protein YaaQ
MKMVMAIMPRGEAERVLRALVAANHTATYMETRGGMLRQAQMTLFIAVAAEEIDQVLTIIKNTCRSEPVVECADDSAINAPKPSKPRLGGAVVFIWDIARSETY